MTNLWLAAVALLNLILTGTLIYFIRQRHDDARLRAEDARRAGELAALRAALDNLVGNTLEISTKLSREIESKRTVAFELFAQLEQEQKGLLAVAEELNKAALKLRGKCDGEQRAERYADALRLAENGLTAQEISRQVNIPVGEIELVLNLRK